MAGGNRYTLVIAAVQAPESGRRVDRARLRANGWTPRFPDYRSGYAELLASAAP